MKMKKENLTNKAKRYVVALIVAALALSNLAVLTVGAAGSAEVKYVAYSECQLNQGVPIEEDYIFGGWYSNNGENKEVLRQLPTDKSNVYAKMVPSYVLSVKIQIDTDTKENGTNANENAKMRVLSAVDSTDYQEVGFEIWLGSRDHAEEIEPVTSVYKSLTYTESGVTQSMSATQTFGSAAQYFSGVNLTNIPDASHASRVYVRPYWKTMDGTKVEGMAKIVHVEDEYAQNQYINVPINLLSGDGVAAGQMVLTYDTAKLDYVDDKGFETGKLLTEMDFNVDETAGTISIAANATTVETHVEADGLFANIRFKALNEDPTGTLLTVSSQQFCDWNEEWVSLAVWDYIN